MEEMGGGFSRYGKGVIFDFVISVLLHYRA